jgi:transaldolase
MKATQVLSDLGQSLWLDNITRKMLKTGVLERYVEEMSVTGLTSNPAIFDHAIRNGDDYDEEIKRKLAEGKSGERLFFELALEDLRQAADLLRPVFDKTNRALLVRLQEEGARSFANSWADLMSMVGSKCALLKRAS